MKRARKNKFSKEQCKQIGGILKSILHSRGQRQMTKAARPAELVLFAIPWLNNQRRVCIRHSDGEIHACICPSCSNNEAWLTGDGRNGGTPKNIHCLRCRMHSKEQDILKTAGGYRDDSLRVNIQDTL